MKTTHKRDLLSLYDFTRSEITALLAITDTLRFAPTTKPLAGKTAALLFQKPSLRTRVSFEVGVAQLGGSAIFLGNESVGLGEREAVSDVARVLSSYCDVIIARLFEHSLAEELATHSTVPVINALTDLSHPCQILADLYTIKSHGKLSDEMKIVFIGDGNNVANSWIELAGIIPMHFVLAHPEGYGPDNEILARSRATGISTSECVSDPFIAAKEADVLYSDVWMSMGQEAESNARKAIFAGYQINKALLAVAKPDALVMHCLPAHRGEEITDDAIMGKHSVVFEQAENRLHMQKAILAMLAGALPLASSEHHSKPLAVKRAPVKFDPVEWRPEALAYNANTASVAVEEFDEQTEQAVSN